MKQTAVEWLQDYIDKEINKYRMQPMDLNAIHALNHIKHFAFEQAKEMEKQQIIQSNRDGVDMIVNEKHFITGEQYYNETFKNK